MEQTVLSKKNKTHTTYKTVYAFIDSQNLNLSIKNDIKDQKGNIIYNGWKLDFEQFFVYLRDSLKVRRAFIFIGYDPSNQFLYARLQKIGFILIHKPILEHGIKKGNCDAELVLHSMIEYPNYDTAVIVTGDGDFYCLAEYLSEQEKLEYLLIPNKTRYSSLLRKFGLKIKFVNLLKERLEYQNNKKPA